MMFRHRASRRLKELLPRHSQYGENKRLTKSPDPAEIVLAMLENKNDKK